MKISAFLTQSPIFTVSWAARQFENHLKRLFQTNDLNFLQALILVSILFEEPKKVTPSQLAMVLITSRGNISHNISALEANGLVMRRIDPNDARAYHLLLKPRGKQVAMQVIRTLHQMQNSLEKTLGTAKIASALDVIRQIEEACSLYGR